MKFNPFKILATVASSIPIVKSIWYAVKKDVPRVACDQCGGQGKKGDDQCKKCNGTGKIRQTELNPK